MATAGLGTAQGAPAGCGTAGERQRGAEWGAGGSGEPAVRVMLLRARAELRDSLSPTEDGLWHHTTDLTAG